MLIHKKGNEVIQAVEFALTSYLFWAAWKDLGNILKGNITKTWMLKETVVKSNADLPELYVPD